MLTRRSLLLTQGLGISPKDLEENQIKHFVIIQKPGDVVITGEHVYHQVWSKVSTL
jgi:hypothetical protein